MLLGEDHSDDEVEKYEKKELTTTHKPKQMSEEQQGAIISELNKGFQRLGSGAASSGTFEMLQAGAITSTSGSDGATGMGLLMEAATRRLGKSPSPPAKRARVENHNERDAAAAAKALGPKIPSSATQKNSLMWRAHGPP